MMQAGDPRFEKTFWQWAGIPGDIKTASALATFWITAGRSIMPASGPKYKPWSTATTTAFLPSENNLFNLTEIPVDDILFSLYNKSFFHKMIR